MIEKIVSNFQRFVSYLMCRLEEENADDQQTQNEYVRSHDDDDDDKVFSEK